MEPEPEVPEEPSRLHQCVSCGQQKQCLKCKYCFSNFNKRIYYCGIDCQAGDYPRHKEEEKQEVRTQERATRTTLNICGGKYTGPIETFQTPSNKANHRPLPNTNRGTLVVRDPKTQNKYTFKGFWNSIWPLRGIQEYVDGPRKGEVFEGIFHPQSGLPHKGTIKYTNGRIFNGLLDIHEKYVAGNLFFPGVGTYYGNFENRKINGKGTFKYLTPPGKEYTGDWVDGNHIGFGTLHIPGMYTYTGNFKLIDKKGVPSGQGKLTYPNEKVKEGSYNSGNWATHMSTDVCMANGGSAEGGAAEGGAAGGGAAGGGEEEEGAAGGTGGEGVDSSYGGAVSAYADVVDILSVLHAKINLLEARG
jgi:hypothetical protein